MARKGAKAVKVEHFGTAAEDTADGWSQWYQADEDAVWQKVFRTVRAIGDAQTGRQAQRLKCARLYGNRDIVGLSASKFAKTAPRRREDKIALNVCKSCVDTAAAKIAKNKPRPLFLTSGGDAKLQDRAKKLTKFIDGLFDASHVYARGQQAFVDACVVDTGCVKVTDDGDDIRVERVFVDELYIDEVEAVYGEPQEMHQLKRVDVSKLLAKFKGDPAALHAIKAARKRGESTGDYVEVAMSWRLPSSKTAKDGKYAMSIEGRTLAVEPYDLDYFPFVFLYWTTPFRGFFGSSLVDELVGIQIEINRLLRTIQEAQHLACVPRVYFDSATAATLKPIDNEMGGHYSFSGRPPVISTANAMPSEVYQHLENLYRKAFEITGISQMSATGKKPGGLDSGAALREYNDIETERFVLVGQRYEDFYMQIARVMIDMMRERKGSTKVKTVNGKYVDTIDWKDVDMHDDEFDMRVFPVSFLPSSPAGRLQTVKELVKDGFISDRAQAMSLLDFPDLEAFQNLQTASYDNIRVIVDKILESGEFMSPDKYINVALARQVAQNAYERGQAQGRPQERLDLLDTWMQQLDELDESMQPPAPAAAPNMVPMGGPAPATAPPLVPQAAAPSFAA